jgi:Rhodopirellula transposase DDE domain/Transposase DDE domain
LLKKHQFVRCQAQKKKSFKQHPDRNQQFENITKIKAEYLKNGQPVISMDTKKKEMVCGHLRREFPNLPSYNRCIELLPRCTLALAALFETLKGECTAISIADALLRQRSLIETVFDELKNLSQIEHSRHRSINNHQ